MPRHAAILIAVALLPSLASACGEEGGHIDPPDTSPVSWIAIVPGDPEVARGGQLQLTVTLYGSNGQVLQDRATSWSSADTVLATVTPAGGLVSGRDNGVVTITAICESAVAEVQLLVSSGQPIASVSVVPGSRRVLAGSVMLLEATPRDGAGQPILAPVNIVWVSNNVETAAFDEGAGPVHGTSVFVTFGTEGRGQVTATADRIRNALDYPIRQAAWASVSAARFFSCGVTSERNAYCWGNGNFGHLGTGSLLPEQVPTQVAGPVKFDVVSGGSATACGLSSGLVYCWGREDGRGYNLPSQPDVSLPTLVNGLTTAAEIAVGEEFACATTFGNGVWCWGVNRTGQLGNGNTVSSGSPVSVPAAEQLARISTGRAHACALTFAGAAFCWGSDEHGQLGDAATSNCSAIDATAKCSSSPVTVAGVPALAVVSAGGSHTCGLALDGVAWCWGANDMGQLGSGSSGGDQLTPVAVTGGHHFMTIAAGDGFTCALAVGGEAWCWGSNDYDQLGTNGGPARSSPVAVSTNERFTSLDAGDRHSCAVTTFGIGWCWGSNAAFELGSGRPTIVQAPIRLPG